MGGEDVFVAKYGGTSTGRLFRRSPNRHDQGRKVKIVFSRSGQDDAAAELPVTSYEAYREITAPPMPAPAAGGQLLDAVDACRYRGARQGRVQHRRAHDRRFHDRRSASTCPRSSSGPDRRAGGAFRLCARRWIFGGQSGPGIPDNLIFGDGDLRGRINRGRFDYFTVYGSNTDSFGDAVLIDYTISNGMDVSSSSYICYWVTATDFPAMRCNGEE
jgi:hypothetical protein